MDATAMILLSLILFPAAENDPEWRTQIELGKALLADGDVATAQDHFESAFRIAEQEFNADDGRLAYSAVELGDVLARQSSWEKAQQLYRFALPIYELQGEEWDEHRAYCVKQIADCDFVEQEFAKAESGYKESIDIYSAADQQGSDSILHSLFGLGRTYRALKKWEDARDVLQEAVRRIEASDTKPVNRGDIYLELANVDWAMGAIPSADQAFEKALAESTAAHPSPHPEVARILDSYASFLSATNRPGPAAKMSSRAASIRKSLNLDR